MPYLSIFGLRICKKYFHIWNQYPRIYLIAKFHEKMKTPKFWNKNTLFRYFGARILKNYCHIWNQHARNCHNWVFNLYSEFLYRVRFFQTEFSYKVQSGSRSVFQSMSLFARPLISLGEINSELMMPKDSKLQSFSR